MTNEGGKNRLIQWVRRGTGILRRETFRQEVQRTVRTVETVECREHTVLIGNMQHGAMDACPLCGSKLIPAAKEKALPQLHD